jgi:MFS family permease
MIALCQFGFGFYLQMVIVHIVPSAIDIGIAPALAAGILSISGGASVLGMLSAGFIAERIGYTKLLFISMVIMAFTLAWLLIAGNVWMLYLFAVVFGLFQGAVIPIWTMVPVKMFGMKSIGTIFGILMLMNTIGGAIGVPVSGLIYDITKSYQIAFIMAAGIGVLTIIFSFVLLRYKRKA